VNSLKGVSTLTVHHLDAAGKADLFRRVRGRLRTGGRFILADVVVGDPRNAVTPVCPRHDKPSLVADQLGWLQEAEFRPTVRRQDEDLAIVTADT